MWWRQRGHLLAILMKFERIIDFLNIAMAGSNLALLSRRTCLYTMHVESSTISPKLQPRASVAAEPVLLCLRTEGQLEIGDKLGSSLLLRLAKGAKLIFHGSSESTHPVVEPSCASR